MTLTQRHRLRITLSLLLVILTALTLLCRHELAPMAEKLIATKVDNQASDAINLAIGEQIAAGEIAYDRMVIIEKDSSGNVTAVRTNMEEINRLKASVLYRVDEKLEQLSWEQLGVPIGSVLLPELFSGRGPDVPVRVLAVRTSDAVFRNEFSEAGINQTLHQIILNVEVPVTIFLPGKVEELTVSTAFCIAETVIVGAVPNTYLQADRLQLHK